MQGLYAPSGNEKRLPFAEELAPFFEAVGAVVYGHDTPIDRVAEETFLDLERRNGLLLNPGSERRAEAAFSTVQLT